MLPLPNTNVPGGACQVSPCVPVSSSDPVITSSRLTGTVTLGGLFSEPPTDAPPTGLAVARRLPGASDLERNSSNEVIVRWAVACQDGIDRPYLAVGPKPPNLPYHETAEAMYYHFSNAGPGYSARSSPVDPVGTNWSFCPRQPVPENDGFPQPIAPDQSQAIQRATRGNPVVVLENRAGARAGRIFTTSTQSAGAQSANPPAITWSDVGGGPILGGQNPWARFQVLDRYWIPGAQPQSLTGILVNVSAGPPVPSDVAGGFQSYASLCTDPNDPSQVYVGFLGRGVETLNQVDVFIAWTNTGSEIPSQTSPGPTFQTSDPNNGIPTERRRTYRIPDAHFFLPGESTAGVHYEQFMPTLRIDELGGINLTVCLAVEDATNPPGQTPVTVRYLRWPSRQAPEASLQGGPPPHVSVLSPVFHRFGNAGNDYMGFDTWGCLAYAIWSDHQDIYLTRIILPCPADADASGVIDSADPIAFADYYTLLDPRADVNRDTQINTQDIADFMSAYTCGPCPIPPP